MHHQTLSMFHFKKLFMSKDRIVSSAFEKVMQLRFVGSLLQQRVSVCSISNTTLDEGTSSSLFITHTVILMHRLKMRTSFLIKNPQFYNLLVCFCILYGFSTGGTLVIYNGVEVHNLGYVRAQRYT